MICGWYMAKVSYFKAPRGWKPSAPNPFTHDGAYGWSWSCFCIDGVDRRVNFCGGGKREPFTFCLGVDAPHLTSSLGDFLRYENKHKHANQTA